MNSRRFAVRAAVLGAIAIVPTLAQQNPYLGRWNVTGTGEHSNDVYWLEIKEEAGQLTGLFLNRGGSPVKLATVKVENGELTFQMPAPQRGNAPEGRMRLQGGKLAGTVTAGGGTIEVVGVHPPTWPAANANAAHMFGKPVELFDGKTMDGWDLQNKSRPSGWSVVDGAMTNTPPANNLVSTQKFQDFKIHAEYKLDTHSNSGIYLRGRYELQVLDDYGKPPDEHSHMSVYAWKKPLVNASKPVGEWQTMEATLVANKVTVFLNGQKVQDNVTIEAITGGALDADETAPGPIMLQGDHEKVWYRKVTITPMTDTRR